MSSDLSKKSDKAVVDALVTTVGGKADKGEAHTKAEADARFAAKATEATATAAKTTADAAMPKAGGTFTGAITVQTATAANHPVTKGVYDTTVTLLGNVSTQAAAAMPKSGGTFTGAVSVPAATAAAHPVRKDVYDTAIFALTAEIEALKAVNRPPSVWYNARNLDLGSVSFKCRTEWVGDVKLLRLSGFITGAIPEGRWTKAVLIYANAMQIPPGEIVGQTAICPTDNPRRLCLVQLVKGSDGTAPVIQVQPVAYTTGAHTHSVTTTFTGTIAVNEATVQPTAPITSVDLHNALFDLTNVTRSSGGGDGTDLPEPEKEGRE